VTPLWFWEFPPTIVLRPALVEDADRVFLPEKVEAPHPPTNLPEQVLRPPWAIDPDIVVLTREEANRNRHLAAQLPVEVWAKVSECLRSDPEASNYWIADCVRNDPKTKPLVAHLERRSLADKIGEFKINRR
jgi:hypothetical protein